jgi:hypothetical protein
MPAAGRRGGARGQGVRTRGPGGERVPPAPGRDGPAVAGQRSIMALCWGTQVSSRPRPDLARADRSQSHTYWRFRRGCRSGRRGQPGTATAAPARPGRRGRPRRPDVIAVVAGRATPVFVYDGHGAQLPASVGVVVAARAAHQLTQPKPAGLARISFRGQGDPNKRDARWLPAGMEATAGAAMCGGCDPGNLSVLTAGISSRQCGGRRCAVLAMTCGISASLVVGPAPAPEVPPPATVGAFQGAPPARSRATGAAHPGSRIHAEDLGDLVRVRRSVDAEDSTARIRGEPQR